MNIKSIPIIAALAVLSAACVIQFFDLRSMGEYLKKQDALEASIRSRVPVTPEDALDLAIDLAGPNYLKANLLTVKGNHGAGEDAELSRLLGQYAELKLKQAQKIKADANVGGGK